VTPVFLDTGYVIALEAQDDQRHAEALQHWTQLSARLPPLVTTSYVFDELVTFFNSRNRHAKAIEVGSRLLTSPTVQLVHVDQPLFYSAWRYFAQHADKSYSLTDCISFLVMKQRGIRTALAFDKHFLQAGFEKLP
jgi:predicted nucleic acid-binding protein